MEENDDWATSVLKMIGTPRIERFHEKLPQKMWVSWGQFIPIPSVPNVAGTSHNLGEQPSTSPVCMSFL
jgi:hypothetical protein